MVYLSQNFISPIPSHLSPDLIQRLEETLGYTFRDEQLRDKMLEAAGSTPSPDGNKRLALVGDAVLKVVLSVHGYNVGFDKVAINNFHETIAINQNLARHGSVKGVDVFIRKNPSQGNRVFDSLRATTMEAIIGAVYIDSNYNLSMTREVIVQLGLLED